MAFAVTIPLSCWAVLYGLCSRAGLPRRSSFLVASLCWGGLLAFITEALSLFQAINFAGVLSAWSLTLLVLVVAFLKTRPHPATAFPSPLLIPPRQWLPAAAGIGGIVGITGLTALIAPPNNYDSLTYHLGRIVHWLQNCSIAHYPTHITRQLYSAPWAEFNALHLQILTGSDHMATLIQWFTMAGCLIGVTLIAQELHGTGLAQLTAAVVCATIPMGILQASSTQNDYVVAFWLVCFLYFLLRDNNRPQGFNLLCMGGSLGLAILTKGTAYPLALPLVIWSLCCNVKHGWLRLCRQLAVLGFMVLALNAGHYLRNYQLFGNPLSTDTERLANETIGLENLLINGGRNLAMQFATPSQNINHKLEDGVIAALGLVGMDADKPALTMGAFRLRPLVQFHEDFAVNPLHLLLIAATLLVVPFCPLLRRNGLLRSYMLALTGSYLLFCLVLKWQPFGSRLLLPLFVTWSPAIGIMLDALFASRVVVTLQVVLVFSALPWLLFNTSRPLLTIPAAVMERLAPGVTANRSILATGRYEQYYANKPQFRGSFDRAAQEAAAAGCTEIGLDVGTDFWEYAQWQALRAVGKAGIRLEHCNVGNASGVLLRRGERFPCTIQAGKDNEPHFRKQ